MAKNKKLVKKYGKIGCEIALVFSARRNRKNAFECSLSWIRSLDCVSQWKPMQFHSQFYRISFITVLFLAADIWHN